jgi:outer membrane protein assembly factor BamB
MGSALLEHCAPAIRRALLATCALVVVACGGQASTSSTATSPSTPRSATAAAGVSTPASPAATAAGSSIPTGDWPNFDYDPARTGVGPSSTGITAGNLGSLRLRQVMIDGIADSSAVELHGVLVHGARRDLLAVTTSYGRTIAIDARTGRTLWEFRPAGVNSSPGNPQVTTATPVVDPDRRYLYAASPNGYIYKLSVATGRQVWSRSVTYDPVHEKIASALNVSGPWVVVVTGGYIGDIPPYDGHVVTIERTTGRIVHVWNSECSNRHLLIRASSCSVTNTHGDNAMWGRAGAVIEPGSGRILTATGNGPFNGSTNWGNSALELSPDASGLLHNWTPPNEAQLDSGDVDVGSASPAILPTYHGYRLAVQGGKDGKLHLLNLARLDGTTHGAGPRLGGELDETSAPGGGEVLTAPAVWRHAGRAYVFVATDSGSAAYQVVDPSHPRLQVAWQNGTGGTSPVLAGGLLYIYDESNGELEIRNPVSGVQLRALPVAHGHWNSPIVVGGRIILPTGSYHDSSSTSVVEIYHLPGR